MNEGSNPSAPARFIVGEVSKNWYRGHGVDGDDTPISAKFEYLIAINVERGYQLRSWQLHQYTRTVPHLRTPPGERDDELIETIVAVFEYVPKAKDPLI